mmetsp:Transcript_30336/g.91185  ORF Transcript_30336/g.91185 Transcript_30336/m.91185 type:complete len:114 (+) Transcript_30336:467-808(+)
MCDNLLRRGKRLFEQKHVSDVLVDLNRSFLLLESFHAAIERTFKHTASHEPSVYAELQRRIASPEKARIDMSVFMQSSQAYFETSLKIDAPTASNSLLVSCFCCLQFIGLSSP